MSVRSILTGGATLVVLVGIATQFQNCAGAKFDQSPSEVSKEGFPTPTPGVNPTSTPIPPDVFKALEPALIVRGSGCVTCHADVTSSVITDLGYGSPWYRSKPNSGYGAYVHDGYQDLKLAANARVYIPKTNDNLAAYMNQLAPSWRQLPIEIRDHIYIGAPTAAQLRAIFGPAKQTYLKDSSASPAVSGISGTSPVFKISGTFTCDGDLFLDGSVHMSSVTVQTIQGCRIYATGSVFVTGGLKQSGLNGSNEFNLQISSATSINLGMSIADVYRHYVDSNYFGDRIQTRHFTNASAFGELVLNEANRYPGLPSAKDEPGGRAKALSRLLVNAPRVDSYYTGNFSGTVVAEAAVMAVGSFKFSYDPVFSRVKKLPQLSSGIYLKVQ